MNRIYKLVKNRSTGSMTAVSELARGAKKGKAAKIAVLSLTALLSTNALAAAIGIPQNVTTPNSVGGAQKVTVSGSGHVIDLGIDNGFADTAKGTEATRHIVSTGDSIAALYQVRYKDVADATQLLNTAQTDLNTAIANNDSPANISVLQQAVNDAQQTYDNKKAASEALKDKINITGDLNLIEQKTEGTSITEKNITYKDPITDKKMELKVIDKLTKTEASNDFPGSPSFEFYEKNEDQHKSSQLVEVIGSSTDVTVIGGTNNAALHAISKDGSGAILVKDGADLTYSTDSSYYTGCSESISKVYDDKFKNGNDYTIDSTITLNEVTFISKTTGQPVNTALGPRSITNEKEFNKFNRELINYIRNNEQLALDYPTAEAMQAFYDQQIAILFSSQPKGTYTINYTITEAEFNQLITDQGLDTAFANKVTDQDTTDRGIKNTSDNYFIGVDGSGSTITISQGNTIHNHIVDGGEAKISDGAVIKADFTNSGSTANNIFQIDGTINANNGKAIVAQNADVNVSTSGVIKGDINLSGTGATSAGNSVVNSGTITGTASISTGTVTNNSGATLGGISGTGKVDVINDGSITESVRVGDSSTVANNSVIGGTVVTGTGSTVTNNSGTIGGDVQTGDNSTVTNDSNSTITGKVTISGSSGYFDNQGIAGGAIVSGGAVVNNHKDIVGNNNFISLDNVGNFNNEGDIYIGYLTNSTSSVDVANTKNESAIKVGNNSQLTNTHSHGQGNIYVSSSQSKLNVISVSDSGSYVQDAGATLTINADLGVPSSNTETGNDNIAVLVDGADSTAKIDGTITLQDSGSTALFAKKGGEITLDGTVDLNSQNIGTTAVRNFGAWIEGVDSKLVMDGTSSINLHADRAIGVHIRDGATAELNGTSEVTFDSTKENQIGFLISGISKAASIIYDTTQKMQLAGEGSVLFRIERGSIFDTNIIQSSVHGNNIYDLSSNGTKNSTLIVITNGAVATGADNQTTANLAGFTLNVDGENAKGVSVEGGAQVNITNDTTINLTGQNSILAKIDGKYYDLNGNDKTSNDNLGNVNGTLNTSTLTSSAVLNSSNVTGIDSIGYYVTNGAVLNHEGTVNFSSPSLNNIGVKIDNGGTLNSKAGSSVKVQGTAVEISGSTSQAIIDNIGIGDTPVIWAIGSTSDDSAYHVKDSANLKLTGDGLTKAEGTAHGILVDDASKIVLDNAFIDLYDNGVGSSSGNGIENRSGLTDVQFTNNARIDVKDGYGIHSSVGFSQASQTSGIINVHGQGTGIRFEGIDTDGTILGTTNNTINNTGYEKVVVNVLDQTGHGIYVDSSQNVKTSASVNIISNTGKSALEIKGTTTTASQSGNLHSQSGDKNTAIVDLNNGHITDFTNDGEILFGQFTKNADDSYTLTSDKNSDTNDRYAVNLTGGNGINFTNNGKVNGIVQLSGQKAVGTTSNKVTLAAGSEGNIFNTGSGDDIFVVNQIIGDDLGGANQAKQFASLDGGAGDDKVTFTTGSDFTITKDSTIKNIEYVGLIGNSIITLNNIDSSDGLNSGTKTYDIQDAGSTLVYQRDGSNINFDRLITGQGTLKVDFEKLDVNGKPTHDFAFDNSTNVGAFTGTVDLNNVNYTLADANGHKNTSALTNATLKASNGSYVTVGNGDQQIDGLTLDGGTVNFGAVDVAKSKSDNHVTVDTLTLEKGTVEVDVSGPVYNSGVPSSLPLLEQDDGIIFTQLASANTVTGGAANLDIDRTKIDLVDQNGDAITDPTQTHLVQNGEEVARATYDVRFTKYNSNGVADGLYLGYGLTQVELKVKNDNSNALILDATNSDPNKSSTSELDAIVTDYDNGDGTYSYGDLQIRGTKNVTLAAQNSYHGSTYVKDTATLTSGNDNALGFTRLLQLSANTLFDLHGWKQSIGSLVTNVNSKVELNGGELTITGIDGTDGNTNLISDVESNTLFGAGDLIIGDSSLTRAAPASPIVNIHGDNSGLTANVLNAVNGTVNQITYGGLGRGDLVNNGIYNLYLSTDDKLSNKTISGNGTLNKYNAGILDFSLAQAQTYAGDININGGAIRFTGDGNTDVNLASTYNAANINIGAGTELIALDYAHFAGNVSNAGTFYVGHEKTAAAPTTQADYKTVKIDGDYVGNSGTLVFNGVLGDDNSWFNKLIIDGDVTGDSYVEVNNIGGLGAKTKDGILLIKINDDKNNGTFTKTGRIMAGAYDYSVMTGKQIDDKLNLTSSNRDSDSVYLWSDESLRPEYGGYITNIFIANNMFDLRLHDRLGETQYTDVFTGEKKITSMWMRNHYSYSNLRAGGGSLRMSNHTNVTQIGGDIAQWSSDDLNRFHLGVMVGYGNSQNKSRSTLSGRKADSKVDGYSYGIYGTWYDNDQDKTGLYVDTWVLWSNLKASVSGDEFSEKYRLKGLTASIESGYSFLADKWGDYDVWLQPKGQLTLGGVKSKDFTEEKSKARIKGNDSNLQTRLGVRASFLRNPIVKDENGESSNHQFFTEVNWLHNSKMYKIKADNLNVEQNGARNIGELKLGVEGNVKNNTNLWLNVAAQRGNDHYKNYAAQVGVKYSF